MNITIQLLKTGYKCIICGSETTSSHWYKEKDSYACAKCHMHIERRRTGVFQDFKQKIAERKCFRCGSQETIEMTNKNGYKYKFWHRLNNEWHCHSCFCRAKDTTLECEQCGKTFLTNYINKNILRTTNKCQDCRGIKKDNSIQKIPSNTTQKQKENDRQN